MDTAAKFLLEFFPNPDSWRMALTVLFALAIFLAGLAVLLAMSRYSDPVRRRMGVAGGMGNSLAESMARTVQAVDQSARFFLPKDEIARKTTLDRLTQAGYRSPQRLAVYYFIRFTLIAGLPGLVLVAVPFFPRVSGNYLLVFLLSAAVFGMIAPSFYLDWKTAKRQRLLRHALPDALDLLVVCCEAGLGLNAALQRVAVEIADIHPAFADDLGIVNAEMQAGIDRDQALKNLAWRTGLEDLKGLAAVLAQSMRFGTSIAQTLRVYSEEFRDKRIQRAEEAAAKLAVKMLFPLGFCLFPGFFVVILGPAMINIYAMFRDLAH